MLRYISRKVRRNAFKKSPFKKSPKSASKLNEEIKNDVEIINDASIIDRSADEDTEPEATRSASIIERNAEEETKPEETRSAPEEIITFIQEYKDEKDIEAPPQVAPASKSTDTDWASSSRSDLKVWECLLMTITLLFIGIVAFSFVFEQWSIDESMYFTVVTLTTCGYGDMSPTTKGGRLFTSFFAIFGISILAVVIGVLGSNIVEAHIGKIEEKKKVAENVTLGKNCEGTSKKNDVVRYFILFLFLFGSARFLFRAENWTIVETIYWMVITSTTIGYGDDYPISDHERLLAVVYILISVGVMGEFLGKISRYVMKQRQTSYLKSIKEHVFNFDDVKLMDADGSGDVSELEYLIFMLKCMDKVDNDLLNDIRSKFKKLDVDGSGAISNANLKTIATKNKKTNVKK